MIVVTLLKDHDPVWEREFEDEDFMEVNELIDSVSEEGVYWVDVNTDEAEKVRQCSACGHLMDEGYICEGNYTYYCSDECRRTVFTDEEWEEAYDDGNGCCYWTTWWDS